MLTDKEILLSEKLFDKFRKEFRNFIMRIPEKDFDKSPIPNIVFLATANLIANVVGALIDHKQALEAFTLINQGAIEAYWNNLQKRKLND